MPNYLSLWCAIIKGFLEIFLLKQALNAECVLNLDNISSIKTFMMQSIRNIWDNLPQNIALITTHTHNPPASPVFLPIRLNY